MEGFFIVLAVFSVPLAAIASSTWLRHKKMQLEAGGMTPQLQQRLLMIENENRELKSRVETLETIATGLEGADGPKQLDAPR